MYVLEMNSLTNENEEIVRLFFGPSLSSILRLLFSFIQFFYYTTIFQLEWKNESFERSQSATVFLSRFAIFLVFTHKHTQSRKLLTKLPLLCRQLYYTL